MKLSVNEVAKQYQISKDSLRYYEKLGIIKPERLENGYRSYGDKEVKMIEYIQVMKYAQFSLKDIKTILSSFDREPTPECFNECRRVFLTRSDLLKEAVANYQKIILLVEDLIPMIDRIGYEKENITNVDKFVTQIFQDIYKVEGN